MPIYEYVCQACNQQFDRLWLSVAAAEGQQPVCPACASSVTRRIVSQVAVLGQTGGLTPQEHSEASAQAEKAASITPREQIQEFQANSQKKRERGL